MKVYMSKMPGNNFYIALNTYLGILSVFALTKINTKKPPKNKNTNTVRIHVITHLTSDRLIDLLHICNIYVSKSNTLPTRPHIFKVNT